MMRLSMMKTTFGPAGLLAALVAVGLSPGPVGAQMAPAMGATPAVGEKARDFALTSLEGTKVLLSGELAKGPVVLVVLRGWPGYQCPFCTRQFGEYLTRADDVKAAGGRVVFVYPGPGEGLQTHAEAFTANKSMPADFTFLTDPEYTFTNAYGLRWDAPGETAYPSTFVLNKGGVVTFAATSRGHGDRVPAADALKALVAAGR